MLCGEFNSSSSWLQLNFIQSSGTHSPYPSLLAFLQGMAAITVQDLNDDEDIILGSKSKSHLHENGRLSYENPNYHLDPACIDDALNSNTTTSDYDHNYQEMDDIMGHYIKGFLADAPSRKTYASLDIGSMGVDINTDLLVRGTSNCNDNESVRAEVLRSNKYASIDDSDIPYTQLCSNRRKSEKPVDDIDSNTESSKSDDSPLPPGWEKHEDTEGPYYWHIKSGTIQRERPICSNRNMEKEFNALITSPMIELDKSSFIRSNTSSALDMELEDQRKKENMAFKRRSYPSKSESNNKELPIRFAVRSLGWVEIGEEDLTPEKSSKAVNKCIVDLSLGKNDLLDVVGRWGDGKDLFMDLDEGALKLIDPENFTILNTQPIHTIRVWGVGRENGRDFAYVARDRITRKHMCHVFRCDMPARTIANTLRDICKKIMIERCLQQNFGKLFDINSKSKAVRPTNLPTESRRTMRNHQGVVYQSFPTPMEEPKKMIHAHYLGSIQVSQAVGMDVLNDAIDKLSAKPKNQWQFVNISVAPSMITIQHPDDNSLITECRVRYLSFLGIGKVVTNCAFIMHTAQDTFIAHVFYCEPSSGALCKTIEAACKLRYQKCLDAHPNGLERGQFNSPGKSIGATIKNLVGSLTGRKNKSIDS